MTVVAGNTASAPFRPVFIVGCERSGTTLLAVLLDRHSQLAITPETHFFLRMIGRPRPANCRDLTTHEQFLNQLFSNDRMKDLALDRAAVTARFQTRPATAPALFQCILEEYAAMHGKPRAGEKTPLHIWYVPQIIEWFPDAKIIGIVRDGRDVVRSMLAAPWTTDKRLRPHCLNWIHAVRAAPAFPNNSPSTSASCAMKTFCLRPKRRSPPSTNFSISPSNPRNSPRKTSARMSSPPGKMTGKTKPPNPSTPRASATGKNTSPTKNASSSTQ
jgi:hypothetical protein